MVAGWVVVVGVLLLADLSEGVLEVFDVASQPCLDFVGKGFTDEDFLGDLVIDFDKSLEVVGLKCEDD